MNFTYVINGGQTDRSFAVRTFGLGHVASIEATMSGLKDAREMSVSLTDKLGNRLTVASN